MYIAPSLSIDPVGQGVLAAGRGEHDETGGFDTGAQPNRLPER